MSAQIKPLQDYVLIQPAEKETTLPSGIVLPDTSKEKPMEGIVISVGPGKKNEDGEAMPINIAVGAKVVYKKWGGTEIKSEGKEYLLVKEEDILAILE